MHERHSQECDGDSSTVEMANSSTGAAIMTISACKARQCSPFRVLARHNWLFHTNTQLQLFVNLLVVVLCGRWSDKLLFIMMFYSLIHSVLRGDAECYADAVLPKQS